MNSKQRELGVKLIKKAFKQIECCGIKGIEGQLKEEKDGTFTFFACDSIGTKKEILQNIEAGKLLKFSLELKEIVETNDNDHPEIFDYDGEDEEEEYEED